MIGGRIDNQRQAFMKTALVLTLFLLSAAPVMAQQVAPASADKTVGSTTNDPMALQDRMVGDLGLGVFHIERNVLGKKHPNTVLPYAYFDYGRFFARLDTFGVKTVRLGAGYLELAARVNFDGFNAERGLRRREHPIPLGIGTYQETRFGAFFLNAFYDVNGSHGALYEAVYALQFDAGPVSFYPQVGIERRSASYNDHFVGVTANESAASGFRQYRGGAANSPTLGLSADIAVATNWRLNMTWRRKWLSSAISDSPLVDHKVENMGLVALSYHFK